MRTYMLHTVVLTFSLVLSSTIQLNSFMDITLLLVSSLGLLVDLSLTVKRVVIFLILSLLRNKVIAMKLTQKLQ